MNENYKQLKSVRQGEDISALKNNIDKVFYNNNEDNVEYWTGLPWMKIWSDSNISMIKDVRVPVTNFQVKQRIINYLGGTPTKALIHNMKSYIRIKGLDKVEGNMTYYAWLDTSDERQCTLMFTMVDYNYGYYTGEYYSGEIIVDDEDEYVILGVTKGSTLYPNSDYPNADFHVTNYILSQQTVSYDKCDGKKVKLYSSNFSLNNMASGLTKAILSEGIPRLEMNMFKNCIGLKEIYISSNTTSILNAFTGCTNLTAIYYKGSATGAPWGASNATVISE